MPSSSLSSRIVRSRLGIQIRCQFPRLRQLRTFPHPSCSRTSAPMTHVRTSTTVGRHPRGGAPSPPSRWLARASRGAPGTERPGTAARQSRQFANDDLNTAAILGFRRFRQGYKAQSVSLVILTPGPRLPRWRCPEAGPARQPVGTTTPLWDIRGARIACDSGADRDVDTMVNRGEVIVASGKGPKHATGWIRALPIPTGPSNRRPHVSTSGWPSRRTLT